MLVKVRSCVLRMETLDWGKVHDLYGLTQKKKESPIELYLPHRL